MYGWRPTSSRSHHGYKVLQQKADGQSSESFTAASLYHTALKRTWEGRHAFMSIQCFLGIGTRQSRPGDKIRIFLDAKVPSILPRSEFGQLQLIGEAYVHGIMDGECMDMKVSVEQIESC